MMRCTDTPGSHCLPSSSEPDPRFFGAHSLRRKRVAAGHITHFQTDGIPPFVKKKIQVGHSHDINVCVISNGFFKCNQRSLVCVKGFPQTQSFWADKRTSGLLLASNHNDPIYR